MVHRSPTKHSSFAHLLIRLGLILAACLLFSLPPQGAHAQGSIRYAKPVATGTGDCLSWANACTLQTALTGASAGAEIWVMQGAHTPGAACTDTFQLKSGVAVYGGFNGSEIARDQRNIAGNVTTLSGEIGNPSYLSDNIYHVVTGNGTDGTAVLDGFTITRGNAYGAPGGSPNTHGGGMHINNGSPILTNLTFYDNQAHAGAGIYNYGGNPNLTNVTFDSNSAIGFGGGMYNDSGSPTLTNVTFSRNTADFWFAGGMYIRNGNPILTNVTFTGNRSYGYGGLGSYAGGIEIEYGNVTMRNCLFWGNIADDYPEIWNRGALSITNSVVQGGCPSDSTCTNIITADPVLGTLGNYGGGTATVPLLPGSSAIDAASAICPITDQRGIVRPQGTACDIGAFESRQGYTLTKTSGDNQGAIINHAFANPLVVAVSSAYGEPVDGVRVTFTPPGSGASATITGSPATITAGQASVTATANGNAGSYQVTASAAGLNLVSFNLVNENPVYYAKPSATGGGNCGDWANACTLQTALTNVSANAGIEIWVAAGTHTPGTNRTDTFQLKSGVGVYGGFAGTETARNQRDIAANVTTLSGEIGAAGMDDNSYHVVTGSGADSTAVLDGFTISSANASGSYPYDYGGGMYINSGSPTLTNLTFLYNSALDRGGGISLSDSNSIMTNLAIEYNYASEGAGMFIVGGNPSLTNATFYTNGWGGLRIQDSNPTLTNLTFQGNYGDGGGIYNDFSNPTIRNTILWGNSYEIYNYFSSPTISDSVIQGGCPSGSSCTNIITADPLLGTLGDYGGGTETIPLLPGSSAIDATDANCPASDQRGETRSSPSCDIGAFESQGFTLSISGGNNQSTLINTAFTDPLQVSVSPVNAGEPVNGGRVTFTPPGSGASALISSSPATIASSAASVSATANNTVGAYQVTASTAGANSVNFDLINLQGPDLEATKANDAGDAGVVGASFNWTATLSNTGDSDATFGDGQTIFKDDLPATGATYGAPTAQNFTNITNSGNINCQIVGTTLTCTADGADVTLGATTGEFEVVFEATPNAAGELVNPRGTGVCRVDPDGNVAESDETNNNCADTVSITNAPTDIALSNDSVDENQPANTLVGAFSTTDPDAGDTHSYSLQTTGGCAGLGADNGSFTLAGTGNRELRTNVEFDYETKSSYDICVRTDDGHGGVYDEAFTINVNNVNEAPVNTVPGAQTTDEDTTLVFSAGNGNSISISDVDAGTNPVEVTLTASHGAVTLNELTGLTFSAGDGTADATMTFTGTMASINTALNGMEFDPTPGYTGLASLQIKTDDQGNTGSGGPLDDTDLVQITVRPVADLSLSKSGERAGGAGTPITYTIVVRNLGPSDANGSTVTDNLPAEVLSPSWVCIAGGGASCGDASGSGNINQTVDLPAGGVVTYTVTGTANTDDPIPNTARVDPPAGVSDPETGNNQGVSSDASLRPCYLPLIMRSYAP